MVDNDMDNVMQLQSLVKGIPTEDYVSFYEDPSHQIKEEQMKRIMGIAHSMGYDMVEANRDDELMHHFEITGLEDDESNDRIKGRIKDYYQMEYGYLWADDLDKN